MAELWCLPDSPDFLDFVTDTLGSEAKKLYAKGESILKLHQILVSRYLRDASPYRGLLLYHGLGVGKTCSAIAILNSLTTNRKAWVLLPASLKGNFLAEFAKCGAKEYSTEAHWEKGESGWKSDFSRPSNFQGLEKTEQDEVLKAVSKRVASHVRFLSFNGVSRKALAELSATGNPFDNSVVCIDECHKFTQSLANYDDTKDRKAGRVLYDMLYGAKNVRIVLLSGTPIINLPVELAYIVNLLRGKLTEHFLRWQKPLSAAEIQEATETLLQNPCVFSVKVDAAGATVQFVNKGFALQDRARAIVKLDPGASSKALTSTVRSVAKFAGKGAEYSVGEFEALPTSVEFDRMFVSGENIVKKTILQRRMRGCISYFAARDESLYPSVTQRTVLVPMSDEVYTEYAGARVAERKLEEKRALDENAPSVHRTYSRAACNFVFPASSNIRKWYKSQVRERLKLEQEIKDGGTGSTSQAAVDKEYDRLMRESLGKLKQNALWNDDRLLATQSPKFAAVLASLNSHPGCAFVYSTFRAIEGLGLFAYLLEKRGYARVDVIKSPRGMRLKITGDGKLRYMLPVLNTDEGTAMLDIYNGEWQRLPASLQRDVTTAFGTAGNLRGEAVKVMMISGSGAQGINLMNIRSGHILEPHWNTTQLEQVAGRAVRMNSHTKLPPDERNVKIYTYVLTFSEHQRSLKEFKVMQVYDKGLTSDEHLLEISRRKARLIGQLQSLMRSVAIDCQVHAPVHKDHVGCYQAPSAFGKTLPMMPANINDDVEDPSTVLKMRRYTVNVRGAPVAVAIIGARVYKDDEYSKLGKNAKPIGSVSVVNGKEKMKLTVV